MKKFVVIYHASADAQKKAENSNPDEMKGAMEAWMGWAKRCGDGLVDIGTPLGNGLHVSKSGNTPSAREVVGYSILQADSIEDAAKMLEGHPHLEWDAGCEIEIHESLPMPE